MTRADFVRAYAARNGKSAEWADIGLVDVGGKTLFALPCGCPDPACEGWAMCSPDSALHHLFFCTPEPLRIAYMAAVDKP